MRRGPAGNLATEDLVSMLADMGIETGVDLDKLIQAGALAQELVGRKLPGRGCRRRVGRRSPERRGRRPRRSHGESLWWKIAGRFAS